MLDINVLSEMMLAAPSERVAHWLAKHSGAFITSITKAELLNGIGMLMAGKRRSALAAAAEGMLEQDFAGRILPFDSEAAGIFPIVTAVRRSRGRPISDLDAEIASIVRARGAGLATRNTRDFEHCGIKLINPWLLS